jgi:hypothetical protein
MKAIKISMLALALGLMSFSTINPVQNAISNVATVGGLVWKSETVQVGDIPQGTPKTIEFEFKNNTDKDVLITNVKPACGCTAADYTKTAIAPGKTGYVKATYNAAAAGPFKKSVTVTTSAEETPKVLTFEGTVITKS